MKQLFIIALLIPALVLGVGTVSETRTDLYGMSGGGTYKIGEKVSLTFTADASDGSVPVTSVTLRGFLAKVLTNPGSTAPTSNYDIRLTDPDDSNFDALSAALDNRHTTSTEQVYPLIAGSPGTVTAVRPFLNGVYAVSISGNSVNSATGLIVLYLLNQ